MDKQETKQKLQPKAEPIDNAVPLESRIHLLTIIGEVEGHESLGDRTKSTKYEEILPRLALIEDDEQIEGILILLHTVGGDVEAGLAIAEMIASLSKPTVSLVLGGGHSIGVPLAVSADYSFIVPSATMKDTHPGVPTFPLPFVKALLTFAAVRFLLSVRVSTMIAIPFGP